MGPWLDRLAGPLLDALLAASAWIGLIALAMVAHRQPARRCALARAGLLGAICLVPLSLSGVVPRLDLIAVARSFASPSWTRLPATSIPGRRWIAGALTLAYLLGVVGGLATLLLGWWGWGWMSRRSVEPSRMTRELYEELTAGLKRSRRPRLRVSRRLRSPGVLKILRPLIVIPPELDRPEARDRLRLCLLHELAHAERRDPWFDLLGAIAQALWFPLPHLWWVRAQMRLDHEFLADRRAAGGFGTFGNYASSLVGLADPGPQPKAVGSPAPRATIGGAGSPLFRRVLMLVRCPFAIEANPPRWWRWALPPASACGVLLAASLSLRGIPPPPPPPPTKPGVLRLTRISLPEPAPGRPPHHSCEILAFPLPARFDLTLEVWAPDDEALAQVRIAGHPLTRPVGRDDVSPPSWHRIHLARSDGRVTLEVDDRTILDGVPDFSTTPCLTVKPPEKGPGEFRNIKLSW